MIWNASCLATGSFYHHFFSAEEELITGDNVLKPNLLVYQLVLCPLLVSFDWFRMHTRGGGGDGNYFKNISLQAVSG